LHHNLSTGFTELYYRVTACSCNR